MRDRVRDLREGQREHREIDRRQPHAEEADDDGGRGRGERRGGERQEHRRRRPSHQQRRAVGAHPERRRVTERDHAAGPHQEVQARGE